MHLEQRLRAKQQHLALGQREARAVGIDGDAGGGYCVPIPGSSTSRSL